MEKIWQWIEKIPLYKTLNEHRLFGKLFNREVLLYLFFGVLTTVVSYATYFLPSFLFGKIGYMGVVHYAMQALHIDGYAAKDFSYFEANTISWICAVAFAFVTNKRYVFESKASDRKTVMRELFTFAGGRLGTYVIDQGLMLLFVTGLSVNDKIAKILVQAVIVILNYFISKWIVFRKPAEAEDVPEETESSE